MYARERMRDLRPFSEVELRVYSDLFLEFCTLGGMPAVVRLAIENGNFSGTLAMQRQLIADHREDIKNTPLEPTKGVF